MVVKVTGRFKLKDVTLCLAAMGQVQLHSRGEVPSQLEKGIYHDCNVLAQLMLFSGELG